jgi:hypothetical protein
MRKAIVARQVKREKINQLAARAPCLCSLQRLERKEPLSCKNGEGCKAQCNVFALENTLLFKDTRLRTRTHCCSNVQLAGGTIAGKISAP